MKVKDMIRIKNAIKKDSGSVDLDDVFNIKNALKRSGHYEEPDYGITPYPDKELFSAIKRFQKDKDLKIDGIINPDGETIQALKLFDGSSDIGNAPIQRCPTCGAPHGGSMGDLCPDCTVKS